MTSKLTIGAILLARLAYSQAAAPLPSVWVGGGAAASFPGAVPSGWISYAWLISARGMLYNYTTQNVTYDRAARQVQISTRTGLAPVLRQLGPITILALVDAGAIAQGSSAGASFSGSGFAVLRIGKTNWTLGAGYRAIKNAVGQGQRMFEFGVGRLSP